mmetsp:Transcript_109157/g.326463  ORF Transcript_109157/g.326463 Transcript_109157/m.326463 type:complete len:261 (-) Transcript_109157:894-1676(-)
MPALMNSSSVSSPESVESKSSKTWNTCWPRLTWLLLTPKIFSSPAVASDSWSFASPDLSSSRKIRLSSACRSCSALTSANGNVAPSVSSSPWSLTLSITMGFSTLWIALGLRQLSLFARKPTKDSACVCEALSRPVRMVLVQTFTMSQILLKSSQSIQKRPSFRAVGRKTSLTFGNCSHLLLESLQAPFHSNSLPQGFRISRSRCPSTSATFKRVYAWPSMSPSERLYSTLWVTCNDALMRKLSLSFSSRTLKKSSGSLR